MVMSTFRRRWHYEYTRRTTHRFRDKCPFRFSTSLAPTDPNKEVRLYSFPQYSYSRLLSHFNRLTEGRLAHDTLDKFMRHHVASRKDEIRREIVENGMDNINRKDVFSRLVLANESETEKLPLDDGELVRFGYTAWSRNN